jgi:hypothetical protein
MGRAVACSTSRRIVDVNWEIQAGASAFVTDVPSDEMANDPIRLRILRSMWNTRRRWRRRRRPDLAHAPTTRARDAARRTGLHRGG